MNCNLGHTFALVFANSAAKLQEMLISLEKYCSLWKLTVNPTKTKIMVFGKRKYRGKTKFSFNSNELEIVDTFKYLGILYSYNGNFKCCQKQLKNQALRAMFSLLSKCRKYELTIDTKLELFDRMIVPIVTYGCEIWSYDDVRIVELLQLKFCKYILNVKKSTSNVMVYGELGRFPLAIEMKVRTVMYWFKLVTHNNCKLNTICYNLMYNQSADEDTSYKWLMNVKSTLCNSGLAYVWNQQGDGVKCNWLKLTLRQILRDQYISEWYQILNSSSKCSLYREIKTVFRLEEYLLFDVDVKLITKFRVSNHNLPIETGRYQNIDRADRLCVYCDNCIGDEYHYLMICKNPNLVRKRCAVFTNSKSNSFQQFIMYMKEMSTNITTTSKLIPILKEILNVCK